MSLPVDGRRGEALARGAHPAGERTDLVARWQIASRHSLADSSVTDPELEPVKPGMYTTAQPFMDVYLVTADGSSDNLYERLHASGQRSGVERRTGRPCTSAPSTTKPTTRRFTATQLRLDAWMSSRSGQESYGRLMPTTAGVVAPVEDATHPDDLWLLDAQGTHPLTDLNPQLASLHLQQARTVPFRQRRRRAARRVALQTGCREGRREGAGHHLDLREDDASHPSLQRARSDVHQPGYAMLMPNVKVKVGQTADSFEKCVVPAVNAVRADGLHERALRPLGTQLRRLCHVESDHAHQHLCGGGIGRDAARALPQLGERP